MIWFTADWHLGHSGILVHQPERLKAFGNIEEHDFKIIDQVNEVVGVSDELYFLGDFCWRAGRAGHYRQRLKVRKLYVCQGNHDSNSLMKHVSLMELMFFRKFKVNSKIVKIHMCHYPLLSWDGMHYGGYHLYGHCHGSYEDELDKLFPGRRSMDIGIDATFKLTKQWRPFNLDEIIRRLE